MASTTDIDLVERIVIGQEITRMEAREAGSDALKISYLEGKPQEIADHIRELAASVRGLFIVRAWNDDSVGAKGGRPNPKTAPFSWRITGTGGQPEPTTPPVHVVTRDNSATYEARLQQHAEFVAEIERLKMQLELFTEREKLEREQREREEEAYQEPEPEPPQVDEVERIERIAGIFEKIASRIMPLVLAKPSPQSMTGRNGQASDPDKDAKLLAALARYRSANPDQAAAVEAQLMKDYGDDGNTK
jgi:hypothetical protein